MIINFSKRTPSSVGTKDLSSSHTVCLPQASSMCTEQDIRVAAAHEAGHTLVYMASGRLEKDIKVGVNASPDKNGRIGFLEHCYPKHQLTEKMFAQWFMLVLLAGKFGEHRVHGESSLGSSSDHKYWLEWAQNYLCNHYAGIYYETPQNKFEQERNEEKLENLQQEQLEWLRKFFDVNDQVLKELTNILIEKKTLYHDDLLPLMNKVQVPNGFPIPTISSD